MTQKHSLILLVLIFIFLSSCKKDPNSILGDDLNKDRNINECYVDSIFQITAFTIPDDSLYIQNYTTFLLGTTYSEIFGTTTYNLVTQLYYNPFGSYLQVENEDLQSVDSVILTIPYSKSYPLEANSEFVGRSLILTIYELDEALIASTDIDSAYTIHSEVAYKSEPIYSGSVTLRPPVSTTDSTAEQILKLPPLDKTFGENLVKKLEEAIDNDNISGFSTNQFKGLYFKITPAENSDQSTVASFNTEMTYGTDLSIYFNGNLDSTRASSRYSFSIGTHFTQVIKDRSGSTVESILWDSVAGKDRLYLESVGGSRVRLAFPNLRTLLNDTTKHIAINRAALVFKVANSSANGVLAPSTLHLYKHISGGSLESIIDYSYNGGGTYDAAKGEYRLYITRWMQDLMFHKEKEIPDLDLSAVPEIRFMIPTQVELYGTDGENKVRLEVLYSTIQK
jgi:hypothetical protein